MDVAVLGLKIDGTQIVAATDQLERFSGSAERAERATSSYASAVNDRLSSNDILRAAQEYDRRFSQTAEAVDKVDKSTRRSSVGVHRLNNSLVVLARRATGAHPAIGQVADIVGTFAIGTAKMVPVLAGIAALGFGVRKLSEEAREGNRELERQLGILRDLSAQRGVEARGGSTAVAIEAVQAEARRVATLFQQARALGNETLARQYEDELRGFNTLLRSGLAEQEEVREEARRREIEAERQHQRELFSIQMTTIRALRGHQALGGPSDLIFGSDPLNPVSFVAAGFRGIDGQNPNVVNAGVDHSTLPDRINRSYLAGLEAIGRQQREERDQLRQLELSRRRADRAAIEGLENVGRAYGGVLDQVLALTAATIRLADDPFPNVTSGDRLRGLGFAALSGIGYGASTGSPGLGGLGGAAAGLAAGFGPAGAIVGGVSGIISGLIEQGERADEMRRQWDRVFSDYEDLFATPTAFGALQDRNLAFFQQATGGLSPEAAIANATENALSHIGDGYFENLERLLGIYEANTRAARELAAAEEERYSEDLRVRILRAQGRSEEADFLRLQFQHAREMEEAERLYEDTTVALLGQVHAQELLAFTTAQTTAEIERQLRVFNAPAGFNLGFYSLYYGGGFPPTPPSGPPIGGGGSGSPPPGSYFPPGPGDPTDTVDPFYSRRGGASIVINVNGSGDPTETAKAVRRELEDALYLTGERR